MDDLFGTLRADHDKQRSLMDILIQTSGPGPTRSRTFPKLKEELVKHAEAEEQAFYSLLLTEPRTQALSRHSIAEHREIEAMLEELERTDFDSPGWLPRMKQLREVVVHHLKEEERELFPLASITLSDEQKRELAAEYVHARDDHEAA